MKRLALNMVRKECDGKSKHTAIEICSQKIKRTPSEVSFCC